MTDKPMTAEPDDTMIMTIRLSEWLDISHRASQLAAVTAERDRLQTIINNAANLCILEYEGDGLPTIERLNFTHAFTRNEIRRQITKVLAPTAELESEET